MRRPAFIFLVTGMLVSLAGVCAAQNSPPVVLDQTYSMFANTTLAIPAPGVLTGAADPDDDPLTAELVSATNGFTVVIAADGGFAYTPRAGFVGTNCFIFAANDGQDNTTTGTVCVIVNGPTAVNDSYTVAEDGVLTVPAPGVLGNDSNSLPNALSAALVSLPTHGDLVLNADGSFTYIPEPNYNSGSFFITPDRFQYVAHDGVATSRPATVFITVTPVNGAGDVNLYLETYRYRQRRSVLNRDDFSLAGRINPRGAKPDLTGATFTLDLNGLPVGIPATLDARGRGTSVSSSGVVVRAQFNGDTGAFTAKIRGLDLSRLGVPNRTGLGADLLTVRVTIEGAGLAVPQVAGQFRGRNATLADKYTIGLFKYALYETPTGVFQSHHSLARQAGERFQFQFAGPFQPENTVTNLATGDIRIQIGDATILVASNFVAGLPDIRLKNGAVPELTQFSISSRLRSFRIQTTAITEPDLAAANRSTNLTHVVPLRLEVPMANGTNYYESFIELRRSDPYSPVWSR
jgi:hypothetical protein